MSSIQTDFFDCLKTERRCTCGRFFVVPIGQKSTYCPECENRKWGRDYE